MMKSGQSIFRSSWFHYILAFVLVGGMLIVRLNLPVGFGERPLLILFILPVIISALIGGLGPGIAATILASAITAYNMPPAGKFAFRSGYDLFQWIVLIIDSLVVSLISEWLHSMRRKESGRSAQLELSNEALRQSEEKYRTLIDNIPQRIFIKDRNSVYVSCNVQYAADIGIQTNDICGKTDYDFHPADLAEKYRADDARVMESSHTVSCEENYNLLGKNAWIYTIKTPIIDKNGSVAGILGIFSDITERKLAEKMLAHSHDLMRYIIEHANSAIAVHDRDLKYIYVSERYLNDYNVKEKNIIGKHHYDVFPDLPQKWRDVHQRVLAGEILSADRDSYPRADGSVEWTRWECRPWYESNGSIGGIILYTEVITDRVLAEEELVQAQKMESIGRLAGGVAHDFNNKLGVILGYAELAISKAEPDSQMSEHLKQISIAAQRSAEITRQLLAFARKQTIMPKALNLNETIDGMIKMLQRLIGENIELAWLPGKELWQVTMDPAQIDQILVNLCVNSKDAISGVGKITIETGNIHFSEKDCSANKDIAPGNFVQLSVCDTGCGMCKETISNLFEPFYTTKEIGKGTGLGLATVYGIVKQNNGFINVYSEPEKGSTFRIYLPANKGQNNLPTDERTQDIPMPLGNEKILLVEDEPSLLQMSATMLEMLGYTVFAADTPAKAIQIASEHGNDIQLLITDVIMPEMNGRELSKMLLALYPEMKLIFMSGYTADAIAHHGVLGKDMHFIQKPFSVMGLAAIVKQALGEGGEDARTKS